MCEPFFPPCIHITHTAAVNFIQYMENCRKTFAPMLSLDAELSVQRSEGRATVTPEPRGGAGGISLAHIYVQEHTHTHKRKRESVQGEKAE